MSAEVDATVAVAITGAVGIVSPLLLSLAASKRQARDFGAQVRQERREAIRDVLDTGAQVLQRVGRRSWLLSQQLDLWGDEELTAETATIVAELTTLYGRLRLWLGEDDTICESWRRAIDAARAEAAVHTWLADSGPVPDDDAWVETTARIGEARRGFVVAEKDYFERSRRFLNDERAGEGVG